MTDKQENPGTEKPEFTVIKDLTPPADVQAHAAAIIENIPEPTESAIEVHAHETAQIEQAASGLVDKNGNSFDPQLHQVDKDGKPKESATGKLMLKRGRKSGATRSKPKSTVNIPGAQGKQEPGQPGLTESQLQQAAVTGNVAASMLVNVSMMIGGKDFAPGKDPATGIDEKAALDSAFTDYFIATGKTDFPPGVALTLTIGMYVLPRLTMPTVQTNLKAKGGRIYTWWQNRKLKKLHKKQAKEAETNGAQSNTGNDGKRENNAGQTISAELQA